jgi:ATP-dependent Clp protease adapter protein ClpS
MPAFSQNLDQSLRRAAALAERWCHECTMPEHLLLALTEDPDATRVMQACNVDLQKLRDGILASLSPPPDGTVPPTSQNFETDLQRAAVHAESVGREEISGAHVLVAMLAGPAARFLHEQGMTRYDATTFISHGITKDAQATQRRASEIVERSAPNASSDDSAGSSTFKVWLLNDDYTTMEFVVYMLEEVFEFEHEDAVRIMIQTHEEGMGECGVFAREEAEAKATRVMNLAHQDQQPLRCVLKPAVRREAEEDWGKPKRANG